MSDDVDGPHQEKRRWQREDEWREEQRKRLNVVSVFERLGYDLTSSEDISRLNENLRYTERERKRREWMESHKISWVISLALVIIGAAATTALNWLTGKFSGTMPK